MGRKQDFISYSREDIPNKVGTKLMVLTFDAEWIQAEVVLLDGIHRLKNVSIDRVHAWKLVK